MVIFICHWLLEIESKIHLEHLKGKHVLVIQAYEFMMQDQGWIQGGGGAPGARPPPKIGKNMIFWRKIVIFHTKYPKIFRVSLRNWKEYDFLA